jgi:hypothetical protein
MQARNLTKGSADASEQVEPSIAWHQEMAISTKAGVAQELHRRAKGRSLTWYDVRCWMVAPETPPQQHAAMVASAARNIDRCP